MAEGPNLVQFGGTATGPLFNFDRLANKLGVTLAMTGLTILAGIAIVIATIVSQRFSVIEATELHSSLARASAILEDAQHVIQKKTADWALWTESFDYVHDGNAGFENENVTVTLAQNLGVNALGFARFDRVPRRLDYYDVKTGKIDAAMSARLAELVDSDRIIQRARVNPEFSFFAALGQRIVAIAIVQSRMNDGSGTPEGFVVMAQELDPAEINQAMQVSSRYEIETAKPLGILFTNSNQAIMRAGIFGLDKERIGSLYYPQARSMMVAGRQLQQAMIAGVGLLIAIMILVLAFTLKRIVIAPLRSLESHVTKIGRTGELAVIGVDGRRDEIGSLTTGFNEMIAQLVDLRTRLERQSFMLGKNQNAIGSMHNVKNGLSPVTTMLSLIPQKLGFSGKADLARALGELASPETEAVRRQQLAAFASATVDNLVGQIESARELASEASRSLAHAVETLTHDRASNEAASNEGHCDLTAVVAAGLSIATYNDQGAAIAIDYVDEQKRLTGGNRVLITQIVGNVLTNAVEAIVASGREDGQITVRGETVSHGGVTMEQLVITDNGDGFDRDVAAQLFDRGFSTRDHKDGGLGLHWCANTLGAMGGVLSLHSDGKGKGATIRVAIPAASQAAPDISQAA